MAANAVALLTRFDGFNISDKESAMIAEPLGRIIARNETVSQAYVKASDPLSLIVAVVTVFLPRVILYKTLTRRPAPQAAAPHGVAPSDPTGAVKNVQKPFLDIVAG